MTKVLITGAYGFIGRHLARHLASKNMEIAGLGHGAWPEIHHKIWGVSNWINGDISASNLSQIQSCCGRPDIIYHLAGGSSVGAAMLHPLEDFTRTVATTATLLQWVQQNTPETKLIAISSAAVYGPDYRGAISEKAAASPFSFYGSHKLMLEELCRAYAMNFGLNVILPRPFSVYGKGLRKQLLWDLCSKIKSGSELRLGGTGHEMRDWINIADLVEALSLISELASPSAPVINIGTGIGTPVRTIAKLVLDNWKEQNLDGKSITFNGEGRLGDPFSLIADITTLTKTGFKPKVSIGTGLSDYVSWYSSQSGD